MKRCKKIKKDEKRTYLVRAEEEQTTADDSSQEGEKKKGENINTTPSTSYKQHDKGFGAIDTHGGACIAQSAQEEKGQVATSNAQCRRSEVNISPASSWCGLSSRKTQPCQELWQTRRSCWHGRAA